MIVKQVSHVGFFLKALLSTLVTAVKKTHREGSDEICKRRKIWLQGGAQKVRTKRKDRTAGAMTFIIDAT